MQHRLQPSLRLQQAPRWGFVCAWPSPSLLWKARWPFNGMVIVSYCCTNACACVLWSRPSYGRAAVHWYDYKGLDQMCRPAVQDTEISLSSVWVKRYRASSGNTKVQAQRSSVQFLKLLPGCPLVLFCFCFFFIVIFGRAIESEHLRSLSESCLWNAAFIQHFPLHWLLSPQGKCFACVYVGERGRVCSPYMVM